MGVAVCPVSLRLFIDPTCHSAFRYGTPLLRSATRQLSATSRQPPGSSGTQPGTYSLPH